MNSCRGWTTNQHCGSTERFITACVAAFNSFNPTAMTESATNFRHREFREMVEQKFNDALHEAGGDWSDCSAAMDEHWKDLLDIMSQEISDRASDFIRERQRKAERLDPEPSLSAAERNPNLR